MSDQNNNQQGYVQGYPQQGAQMNQNMYQQGYMPSGQPQGYPQQADQMSQNMYQQGYVQNGQPQGYPQQIPQMQGYQQQYYQQPAGGGVRPPQPKKSKTGLIVGIAIAAVVLIVGAILLIFKDSIFGSDGDDKKTEVTTEITTEFDPQVVTEENPDPVIDEGGFENYEDLLPGYWEAFEYCDKDLMYKCFYVKHWETEEAAQSNYDNALSKADSVEVHFTDMTVEYDMNGDMGLVSENIDGREVIDVKEYHCEVPMTQEVDGVTYEIVDIYEGTIFQLDNEKWYLSVMQEVDVQIISTSAEDTIAPDTTETQELGDTKTMGSPECGYIDVPADWVRFVEADGIEGTEASYQTASADATSIVTMCVYNDLDPYTAASNMYTGISGEEDVLEVVSAMATIGGYEAYQVYAAYEDGFFVTYFFDTGDGKCRYVAIEFPIDQAGSGLFQQIESSYRLTE